MLQRVVIAFRERVVMKQFHGQALDAVRTLLKRRIGKHEAITVALLQTLLPGRRFRALTLFMEGSRDFLPEYVVQALVKVNILPLEFFDLMERGGIFAEIFLGDLADLEAFIDERCGPPRLTLRYEDYWE